MTDIIQPQDKITQKLKDWMLYCYKRNIQKPFPCWIVVANFPQDIVQQGEDAMNLARHLPKQESRDFYRRRMDEIDAMAKSFMEPILARLKECGARQLSYNFNASGHVDLHASADTIAKIVELPEVKTIGFPIYATFSACPSSLHDTHVDPMDEPEQTDCSTPSTHSPS
jgi:hypothetical protein